VAAASEALRWFNEAKATALMAPALVPRKMEGFWSAASRAGSRTESNPAS